MEIKQKKGISLIVLVITIVVMIILATVVILSLDSSNIIERANEAREATNLANLKEAANVALAEYKLEVSLGNLDERTISANAYVKNKLEEQGMDASTLAITKDGKVMTGLSEIAVKFVELGVEIGATVTGYDLSSNTRTTYTTSGNENTAPDFRETEPTSQNVKRATTLEWKYIGISEKGEALIILDTVTGASQMQLSGKGGYLNGPKELNLACDALYSSNMGKARSVAVEDVNMVLGIKPIGTYYSESKNNLIENPQGLTIGEIVSQKGEPALTGVTPDGKDINEYEANYYWSLKESVKASDISNSIVYKNLEYWLASSCVYAMFYIDVLEPIAEFSIRSVNNNSIRVLKSFDSGGYSDCHTYSVRPVIELNDNINITVNSNGTVTLS